MKEYRADLHVHTLLSPCGDLEMSPVNILNTARSKHIDILGITDHNHTGNAWLIKKMAEKAQILVLPGAEVTTREEVHCLAFFKSESALTHFQEFLDQAILRIPHNPELFGYQIIVDSEEQIVSEIDYYLGSAVNASIEEVEEMVHSLGGLFIPAHIDRSKNSIYSQLGFIPEGLNCDALEVSWRTGLNTFLAAHPELDGNCFTRSSDAHFLPDIGRITTFFLLDHLAIDEIWMAFRTENGRKILAA